MIYWMERSGSIHSMKQPTEEQQTLSGEEPPVSRAARLEEAPGWHRPSLRPLRLHTNRVAPVRETPPELRELERYLILALALVSASLLTGLVERAHSQAYLTAMGSRWRSRCASSAAPLWCGCAAPRKALCGRACRWRATT